jgi:predicted phage terminase large subunit-like protein
MNTITPAIAAQEVVRRRTIRNSFDAWCRFNGYKPAAHHRLLISKLQAVSEGRIQRLAIFMPPGSAKSTYASVLFPPFYLANHPDHVLLACAHTTELAKRWGRRVRNLIAEHEIMLGISLSDEAAADRWRIVQGGEYKAAGINTAIAGLRSDCVLVDDPVRSREDADSNLVQNRTWEWYKADVMPRAKPESKYILIQTRWSLSDLAARILEEMENGGDQWHVLSLPAQAGENDVLGRKPGEFLWADDPDYGYGDLLKEQKATQLPRNWSALYQQSPVLDTVDYFKAEWLIPYDHAPPLDTLKTYGASDYATTKDGGDFTCHIIVGLDAAEDLYLLDVYRKQTTPDKWAEAFCDLVVKWKPLDWAEEGGQIKASVGPFLETMQRERRAWVNREPFPARGDKSVRAQSIRGRMAVKGLRVPIHAPWYADFRAELLNFPAGRHDDMVDALGLIGQLLDLMVPGRVSKEVKAARREDYVEKNTADDDPMCWGL